MEITSKEVFSRNNVKEALEHLHTKNDGAGIDGMKLSELDEYWDINRQEILDSIEDGSYEPGTVQEVEIIAANGKHRIISKIISIDRLILRCLTQQMKKKIEPEFSKFSFAFQEGKGTFQAAKQVVQYLNAGYEWCAEISRLLL